MILNLIPFALEIEKFTVTCVERHLLIFFEGELSWYRIIKDIRAFQS